MAQAAATERWNAIKVKAQERWNRLSDAQLEYVQGNQERLVDALQHEYGYNRFLAEREILNWRQTLSRAPRRQDGGSR